MKKISLETLWYHQQEQLKSCQHKQNQKQKRRRRQCYFPTTTTTTTNSSRLMMIKTVFIVLMLFLGMFPTLTESYSFFGSSNSDDEKTSSRKDKNKSLKDETDLYKILGVSRTATTKEIKQAYRRKALDTHPDKNKDVPPEEAAENFRKVVDAFEILSDTESRRRYDRTGHQQQNNQYQQQSSSSWYDGGGGSWSFSWSWSSSSGSGRSGGGGSNSNRNNRQQQYYQQQQQRRYTYRPPRMKDKREVKEAQSRVMHIISLEQLETVIVDDDITDPITGQGTLERNLLICFFTPPMEEHVNDEMVYPYPFAAMSPQGIWWEDLLQTTTVRYHRTNAITEFFGIPNGNELTEPIFVFGKRASVFDADNAKTWSRLQTKDRNKFNTWMWDQIKVEVEFVNHHDHPVEIYWIHGTRAKISETLQPGQSAIHTTMLSHEWWVRDARTDTRRDSPGRHKLADNNCLITWKIVSDEQRQKLVVPKRTCFDLSGHCSFWKQQGECKRNPIFMSEDCALTCGLCESDRDKPPTATTNNDNDNSNDNDNNNDNTSGNGGEGGTGNGNDEQNGDSKQGSWDDDEL